MSLETTTTPPKVEDFTPLTDHQEQTPTAFFGAKPVLHLHSQNVSVGGTSKDIYSIPALVEFLADDIRELHKQQTGSDRTDAEGASVSINGLDLWVTSKQLTFFAPQINYGVHIPYQSIVVHAAEGEQVVLGLNLSDNDTPDEEMMFVQLRIAPLHNTTHSTNGGTDAAEEDSTDGKPNLAIFNAISACQELNPDPPQEGDEEEEGGFDETAPGATGWITSENMADFMDENGEFKMPEGVTVIGDEGTDGTNGVNGLGEGAGRTRSAAEANGLDGVEDETKWQRTD